jgi:hypothetical protein
VLVSADLRTVELDPEARPATAVTAADDVLGRALAGPMSAGEMLLNNRVVGPGLLGPDSEGQVAMPVRIEDAAEVSFLRPGDRVDVLAADRGGATGESGRPSLCPPRKVPPCPVGQGAARWTLGGGSQGNGVGSVLVVAVPTRIAATGRGRCSIATVRRPQQRLAVMGRQIRHNS